MRPKVPVLVSYHYLRKEGPERVADLLTDDRFEWLLDSGAFSALNVGATIDLEEYIAFLKEWKDHLIGYIALDVLQDPDGTEANLKRMHEAGLVPIPVHVFGDDEARMDHLFETAPWVALGGLRRPHRGHAPKSYVALKMRWAKGRNVHWLGYTRREMVLAHKPYSVDTAAWANSLMYGFVDLYLGRGRWMLGCRYPKVMEKKLYLDARLRSAAAEVGVEPDALLDEETYKGGVDGMPFRISTASWIHYAFDLRERVGTRLFLATGPGHVDGIRAVMDSMEERGWRS